MWICRAPPDTGSVAKFVEVKAFAPKGQRSISYQGLLFSTFPREAKETKLERDGERERNYLQNFIRLFQEMLFKTISLVGQYGGTLAKACQSWPPF